MTPQEIEEEKGVILSEYKALKSILGGLLLESEESNVTKEELAYYTRKFEETRKRLKG